MQAAAMVGPLKQASLSLSTTFALCIHLSLLFLSGASALMLGLGCCYLLSEWGMWRQAAHSGGLQLVSICVCVCRWSQLCKERAAAASEPHAPHAVLLSPLSLLLPTTIDADGDQIDAQMRRRRIHLFFFARIRALRRAHFCLALYIYLIKISR